MAWFIGQSILIIAAAFLLGILVGWLIWGRIWRPKRSAEAEAEADIGAEARTPAAATAAAAAVEFEPEPAKEPEPEPEPEAEEPEPVVAEKPEPEAEEPEPEPEPVPEELALIAAGPETSTAAPLESLAAQPVAAVATLETVEPEDLERIEGIGPKMAGALHEAGIKTYAQLAEADEGALRRAIEARGLRFAPSIVTWSRQARLLADGDEEGFADLTRRLVAGRDEGRE